MKLTKWVQKLPTLFWRVHKLEKKGGVDIESLDTKFKGTSALTGTVIDWDGPQVRTKTLTENTEFTMDNLYVGVKDLEIDGNFTIGFTAYPNFKVIGAYDGTKLNLVEILCTDPSVPKGWIIITQEA